MQSGKEIWPVYAILQNDFFFYEKILRKLWSEN